MERSALYRSRRELSNECLLAKFGFDTAENEPCKGCPLSAYRSPRSEISTWSDENAALKRAVREGMDGDKAGEAGATQEAGLLGIPRSSAATCRIEVYFWRKKGFDASF